MDNQSFISLCAAGLANPLDIDDYVERWHKGHAGQGRELAEYLGMTPDEYSDWVLAPQALLKIVNARIARGRVSVKCWCGI